MEFQNIFNDMVFCASLHIPDSKGQVADNNEIMHSLLAFENVEMGSYNVTPYVYILFTCRMALPASSQRKKLDEMTTALRQLYCLKTSIRNVPILLKGPSVRPKVV